MITGVLFDLGSTLLKFHGDIKQVFLKGAKLLVGYLQAEGIPLDPSTFLQHFHMAREQAVLARENDYIERKSDDLLRGVLESMGYTSVSDQLIQCSVERYFSVSEDQWTIMPGAHEVLTELQDQGCRLGMISNASDADNVHRLIDRNDFRSYFQPILISANLGIRKPHPRIFHMALDAWGCPPQEVVMVGDTLGADILGAQEAGMHQIWLRAQADRPDNHALNDVVIPEAVADTLSEIPVLIQRWNASET